MVDDGKENARDEAVARDGARGQSSRPSGLWGSKPHPLFNLGRHPGPAEQPEYEVRRLTVGEPGQADRQSSTPRDDEQMPSGGAQGNSGDSLDGGLPFTFGLQGSGIQDVRSPRLAAFQGPEAFRLARERLTLEQDSERMMQEQKRMTRGG